MEKPCNKCRNKERSRLFDKICLGCGFDYGNFNMVKEHPILFKGDMVRAILDGPKTETRRIIKPQTNHIQMLSDGRFETSENGGFDNDVKYLKCPFGQPGNRLWVRETLWRNGGYVATNSPSIKNDGKIPSIFMPHSASRITLEITKISVERLQDITEEGAKAEGAQLPNIPMYVDEPLPIYKNAFAILWDSINKKRDYPWDANPWVWVVKFKRVTNVQQA